MAIALPFVSSPLGRARMTMELVRSALKLPVAEYAIDDRLREIGFGHWEGLTVPEMQANDAVTFASRAVIDGALPRPRGESYASVDLADARLVRFGDDGYGHGRPRRHHARADGGLGLATELEAVEIPIGQGVVYVFRDGSLRKYS